METRIRSEHGNRLDRGIDIRQDTAIEGGADVSGENVLREHPDRSDCVGHHLRGSRRLYSYLRSGDT